MSITNSDLVIAFDIQGTLSGPKSESIIKVLTSLQVLGCKVMVWSSYSINEIKDFCKSIQITPDIVCTKQDPIKEPHIIFDDDQSFLMIKKIENENLIGIHV